MSYLRQAIVYTMIFWIPQIGMIQAAQATMISTDQFAAASDRTADLTKVKQMLSRPELARQLESMGVSPDQARLRAEALSNEELAKVAGQADRLPAGGDVFATIGAIFIILLITDLLGLTKIFPFTRSQR